MEHLTLNLNFNPFPTLFTNRLELRQFTNNDLQDYYLISSDERVAKALYKKPKTVEEAKGTFDSIQKNLKENTAISWVICFKENKKLIGYVGFHRIDITNHRAEIGYCLFFNYHQKGIMTEAIKPIINYAFNVMNLHSIEAKTNPINSNSHKLLLNHGFVKEAYFKQDFLFKGKFMDTVVYSLLNKNNCST